MIDECEAAVGTGRIGSLHLNDSQTPLGSNRDRHANIGEGELGLEGARAFVNEPRFQALPCVLETPGPDRSGPTAEEVALVMGLLAPRGPLGAAPATRSLSAATDAAIRTAPPSRCSSSARRLALGSTRNPSPSRSRRSSESSITTSEGPGKVPSTCRRSSIIVGGARGVADAHVQRPRPRALERRGLRARYLLGVGAKGLDGLRDDRRAALLLLVDAAAHDDDRVDRELALELLERGPEHDHLDLPVEVVERREHHVGAGARADLARLR